ncbi:hypothetical protein HCC03_06840 [Streptococcus suis]|nr:hypothetical protein [Streptococcus suis]
MPSKTKQASVFWRLLSYLKAYRLLTVLALSFLLLTTVVRSLIPLLASYFIDHYISSISETAVAILAAYFTLYLLQMVLQYFGNLWFAKVSYSIVRDIRRDAFGRMEKLGMAYFDQTPSGSIVSRITNDTESISEMFSGILSSFISALFIIITTLSTMFALDWKLTCLIVLFLPLIFLLVDQYRKRSAPIVAKTRSLLSAINSKLAESIEGIRIIQAFSQEERLKEEFEAINQEHLDYASRSMALDSLFLRPALSLVKILAYALLMTYFGLDWSQAGISAGLIYAFIQYVNRLFDPLLDVTQHFSTLQTSMVSAGRVFTLMDQTIEEPLQLDRGTKIDKGHIVFEDVCFSYDGKRQILAFARTMASQPKILILDEATANVDSETEQTVQTSLEKMRKGWTTIAIAHRLSTIQDADCIYVLDKGKIIEFGNHEELLAFKGHYHRMYQLQAGQLAAT